MCIKKERKKKAYSEYQMNKLRDDLKWREMAVLESTLVPSLIEGEILERNISV